MSGTFRLFCCFTKVLFISGISRTLYTPISMYQYEGDRVCMCIDFYDTLKMYRTRISSIMDLPIQEAASKGVGREERCGSIFFDIPEVSSTHCTPYSTARAWSNIFTQDQRLYRSFLHRTTSAVCKGHSPDPTGNRESCGSFSAKYLPTPYVGPIIVEISCQVELIPPKPQCAQFIFNSGSFL